MPQRILHITDLHFWEIVRDPRLLLNKRFLGNANVYFKRRHHFLQDRAQSYLDAALVTGVKTVLLGGDFTSTSTEAEFRRARAWVDTLCEKVDEVALLPGNHDVYTLEAVRKQWFEKHFMPLLPDGGYPAGVALKNGISLVMPPTACPNFLSSRGFISGTAVEQTAQLVRDAPPVAPLIVMAHYPCLHKTHAYISGFGRQLTNADALRRALGRTGRPLLYLAGHVHRFSYVQDPDYPQMAHLCTPAFFLHRPGTETSGGFTEIHAAAAGAFEVFLHEHRQEWQRTAQPLCRIDGTPL